MKFYCQSCGFGYPFKPSACGNCNPGATGYFIELDTPATPSSESEKWFAHLNKGEVWLERTKATTNYKSADGNGTVRGLDGFRIVIEEGGEKK